MTHGSGSGYWIRFVKIDFLGGKADLHILRGKRICLFLATCLWRADLSFKNAVTGSGSRAKCSNILQDNMLV